MNNDQNDNSVIYLDYNATTPLSDEVRAFLSKELCDASTWGNCSSPHYFGLKAKKALETSRETVNITLNVPQGGSTIFTSGGTEANNLALIGCFRSMRDQGLGNHIVASNVEHPSVFQVLEYLESCEGATVSYVAIDPKTGNLDPVKFGQAVRVNTVIVTCMHANNETGIVYPISDIVQHVNKKNTVTLVHSDCAQTIGKIPVSMDALGVDLLSVCGHKFYGPKGCGALCYNIRASDFLSNITHGAGHEHGYRPGTENVLLIRCMVIALKSAALFASNIQNMQDIREKRRYLFDYLTSETVEIGANVELNNNFVESEENNLPNTLSIAFRWPTSKGGDYVLASHMCRTLGNEVALSPGSACHSSAVWISHVLKAMNFSDAKALGTVRFSLGRETSTHDINNATQCIVNYLINANLEEVEQERNAAKIDNA